MKGVAMNKRMMSGVVVCAAITFVSIGLQTHVQGAGKQDLTAAPSKMSTELVVVLKQLVEVHEDQLELVTSGYRAKQASHSELINSRIELSKAKIRLANICGERDAAIHELRQVLALREEALSRSKTKFTRGQTSIKEVNVAEIDMLEAKADLYSILINQK
jgi:outer membrane protein TolC